MLLAERRECKDHMSVFDTLNWCLVKHFELETEDLSGIVSSPSGATFCVWDSPLALKVLVYNLEGEMVGKFEPSQWCLGVKCAQWSPSGQILAVGGYDQKVRLLNYITYRVIKEMEHPVKISSQDLVIFKETDGRRDPDETSIYSSPSKCKRKKNKCLNVLGDKIFVFVALR